MKLVSVIGAKAVWLFDANRMNPGGLSHMPILDAVRGRYKFAKAPASMLDVDPGDKAIFFDQGEFVTADKRNLYVSLRGYTDGFVAKTASSTTDSTEFLEDLASLIKSIGFTFPPPEQIRRGFTSVLLVESDASLLAVNPRLSRLIQFIESRLVTMDGKPRNIEVAGISLWSEDASKAYAPNTFKFERKVGQPFDSKLYYSEAPLQTQEHLELLQELEVLLLA